MSFILKELIKARPETQKALAQFKRGLASKFNIKLITNREILKVYKEAVEKELIPKDKNIESVLQRRSMRTLSGVAPVTVLTKPYPCPGRCVYCPTERNMPKSYIATEPAAARALMLHFDPAEQVRMRLKAYYDNGHNPEKAELIVLGGTWSFYPKQYQTWFIKRLYQALNNYPERDEQAKAWKSQTLKEVQQINETAKHRSIGLTLETRPDWINKKELARLRKLGCTRIEIGVQSLDDEVLEYIKRDHKRKEVVEATQLMREAGFKIVYHIMPGLPGSNPEKDVETFRELFENPDFKPDQLKIYPCVVLKNSLLYYWWKDGKYTPYDDETIKEVLIKAKQLIPPYVRIERVIRDIPAPEITAGNKISNFREYVQKEMKARGLRCRCIRCREVGLSFCQPKTLSVIPSASSPVIPSEAQSAELRDLAGGARSATTRAQNDTPMLFVTKYAVSNGTEYFLSYENEDQSVLYAFLRLRIPSDPQNVFLEPLKNATIVRELHTYGRLIPIGEDPQGGAVQHLGLGRKLMQKAEELTHDFGFKKIAVISGVGVREYYRKLDYTLEEKYGYMLKSL